MTVEELKEMLEEMDDDKEIRFAGQPNWPFEYSIRSTYAENNDAIYLAEGRQLGYLPGDIKDELGWRR